MSKIIKNINKSYSKFALLLLVVVAAAMSSCKNDDIASESYYTFTGETVGQFLNNRPDVYSEFRKVLQRCRLKSDGSTMEALMNAYGNFTCFAPNNEAMTKYLEKYGWASVEDMSDSAISVLGRMHVINSVLNTVYESKNFVAKLPDQNMYSKTIYLKNHSTSYMVNEMSVIVEKDLLVHNGVVHQIDSVLEPSDLKLDGFLEKFTEYSLFREAVSLTNIGTRLNTEPEDRNFVPATGFTDINGGTSAITPQNRFFYYTCFIETDEVFENAGIRSLKDMQDSAKVWFQRTYADNQVALNAGLTEKWEDSLNYFNRFVAYHFVNKKIDKMDFYRYDPKTVMTGYMKFYEFSETVAPNQMLYMAAGQNSFTPAMDGVLDYATACQLNPSADQQPLAGSDERLGWSRPVRNGVLLSENPSRESSNGLFHEIKDVLKFNRPDFKKIRFRLDYAELFPEMMSNAIRAKYTNGQQIYMSNGYLSNVWFRTEGTRLYYLNPQHSSTGGWDNYQGDEMMAMGNFDFDIRLPSVPAGQYEVRFGYTRNDARGCAQIYMGTSRDKLLPCGIPIDLTKLSSNYGWVADTGTAEDYDSDKVLHANGWLKGPNSTKAQNGNSSASIRTIAGALRCVVGVVNLNQDGPIYLRFRNATTNESAQFMMDYIEICPASIYDNPNISEPRD